MIFCFQTYVNLMSFLWKSSIPYGNQLYRVPSSILRLHRAASKYQSFWNSKFSRYQFLSSSTHLRMPITELVFPSFKPNVDFKPTITEALRHFDGVEGLLLLRLGRIIQANDAPLPVEKSTLLILGKQQIAQRLLLYDTDNTFFLPEWEQISQFETFFASDEFKQFGAKVKPIAAAPAIPQLFEAHTRSIDCTSAILTQIFKLRVADMREKSAAEEAWQNLVKINDSTEASTRKFFHGWGLQNVEGELLGMIGWESTEVSYAM